MIVSRPPGELRGRVVLPASKYHAHRALILASLAEGTSIIQGRTAAEHVRSTLDVLRRMGTAIRSTRDGYEVTGGPYRPTTDEVSAGSSGSTLQFLLGVLCRSVGGPVVFSGQPALRRRPIGPLLRGLGELGVRLEAEGDRLPVRVYPGRPTGGRVAIAGTLSQWISGLMLLGPLCSRDIEIDVQPPVNERPYLDLTVRMMACFGVRVDSTETYTRMAVAAGQRYLPADVVLPPDMSSAAFLLGAAACLPGSVTFANIDARPDHPEGEILRILRDMGAAMSFAPDKRELRIGNHGVRLQAIRYDCTDTPDLIPLLAVLCAMARGRSVLDHVGHARLKESDRVGAMLQLRKMGARIEQEGDRLIIDGVERLRPATIDAMDDHRVLMAFAVAGACADGGTTEISDGAAYRISYPEFLEHAAALGLPAAVPDGRRSARAATALPTSWQERYRKSGLQPGRLITDYLADNAAWTPERPAVVDTSRGATRVLSYADLRDLVDRLATGLAGLGVRPGEIVAFQLPNWWEFAVLQLALVRIGAVSCPLMPILRQRELTFMLGRTGARVLVIPERFRGVDYPAMIAGIRPQLPKLEHVLVVGQAGPDDPAAFGELLGCAPDQAILAARRPKPDDLTQLLYTSGTSGEPKGVLHTHNSLLASLVAHGRHFRLTDRDNVWVPSPCGHQTGFLYGLWLSVFLGSTGVYQDVWDADRAAELIDRHEARFVQAATPFLSDLTDVCARRGRPPQTLRIFVAAGAPIPRGLAHRARQQLGLHVVGAWGTTESGLCTAGSLAEQPDRLWQTDGRALAGTGTRIVDEQGKDLPAGAEGQFLVWTPGMFVGYYGHPDWYTASFQEDGWFRTGDLGRMDADGYIRITGRIKDVIIRGGEKIPVVEVEELLHAHPAVAEAAVVAMPDPRLGERACAFVVLRAGQGLDLPGLQGYLSEAGMAKQYWPERLEPIAAMPRTPSGKIQKFLLRERLLPAEGVRAGS